jgi:hypothetical protein
MKYGDYIPIARYDPGMQKRIPVNRVFAAQAVKQRVRIGENLGIQKMIEA